ncbi:methyltransferase [Streptomyces sp. BG9H]|uniref:Methyltransferase n=1 Tax=Streptomyces anatolicus TaxID=2675858 RepID=A0ABS6YGA6_9ACTN|nr:HemK2/MTQ2 family protein methyltransferase [Streptomyces anatolicus]MBW5420114.1 methyltransferase [Streptomyces anatolicus]
MTTQTRTPMPPPVRPAHLLAPPGVYAPQHDTELLTRALHREAVGPGTAVLDLGTGTGALAVAAARRGARVTAVDISWRAVLTARLNARLAGQSVTVRHGDLTAAAPKGPYDLVVSNPPYVPSPSPLLPRRGAARAWDGGPAGRAVVDRVCDAAPRALRPGGVLLMVHSALCGVDATLTRLTELGMDAKVTDRRFIPFGPVLRSRRAWLQRRNLLGDDETREELVVIRARFR